MAGGHAESVGLNPNCAPVSSSPIASGPSPPSRSVEDSLNLLANTMAQLTGQLTKVQQQVVDLQAEKATHPGLRLSSMHRSNQTVYILLRVTVSEMLGLLIVNQQAKPYDPTCNLCQQRQTNRQTSRQLCSDSPTQTHPKVN